MPKSDHDKLIEERADRVRLVKDYESRIAEYTQIIKRLTAEGEKQADFQTGLSEEIRRLQAAYREAQESIKAKDTAIEALSSKNDNLETQLQEQEQNLLMSVAGEVEGLQAAKATLEDEKAELEARVRGMEEELDGAVFDFEALEAKNLEKDQEITQLKGQVIELQGLQQQLDGAKAEILALQTQAKEAEAINDAALNSAKTTIASQQHTIAELEAQTDALQVESAERLNGANTAIGDLENKLAAKEKEVKQVKETGDAFIDEAKTAIANQQQTITDQGAKLSEMEKKLQAAEENAKSKDQEILGLMEESLKQRLAKLDDPNIEVLNQTINDQAKIIASLKDKIEKQQANIIQVVAQVQKDEPKIDGPEEAKGVEMPQGESTLSGNSVVSTITLPAGAPTVDHGFLSDANIAKINAALNQAKAGWGELDVSYKNPDIPGSREANSSNGQQKFYVNESKLVTNHQDPKVFVGMLIAFSAANPGVDPVITSPDPAVKAMWEQAVKEVYKDDPKAIERINKKIKVDSPVAEKEQSTKAEQAPGDKLKLKTADRQTQSTQDLLKSTQNSHSVLTPVTTPTPDPNTSPHR